MADEKISVLDAKVTIADTDMFVLVDEEAAPDQTKKITGANLKAAIRKIIDADGDTQIQVEESADEDIVRMDVAGNEAFKLSSIGELTLAKQSGCRVQMTANQIIPHSSWLSAAFDDVIYDIQSEFNNRLISGTADATEASKLHDADGGFEAADVGATVWNTTDNTYAIVTAFVDSGELSLDTDIMVDTEGYKLFHCRFTAKEAGLYLCGGSLYWAALQDAMIVSMGIGKNAVVTHLGRYHCSWIQVGSSNIVSVVQLAVNDYIQFSLQHTGSAANETVNGATPNTYAYIAKLA